MLLSAHGHGTWMVTQTEGQDTFWEKLWGTRRQHSRASPLLESRENGADAQRGRGTHPELATRHLGSRQPLCLSAFTADASLNILH